MLIADPDHSEEEDRFIILGISNNSKVLVVCHCYRENDEVIRIISARKATTNEKKILLCGRPHWGAFGVI
ncbi:MAG: BrnT family toxin [Treponema sp.]|nr:BrnT family toxin [Treponema sp.]